MVQGGYVQLVELNHVGDHDYNLDDVNTTSADEETSGHCVTSSSESSSGTSGAEGRGGAGAKFDPFNSSSGDEVRAFGNSERKRQMSRQPSNLVKVAPPYDFMPVIMDVAAMTANQFAAPRLVSPTLYAEPNETDDERILPVRLRSDLSTESIRKHPRDGRVARGRDPNDGNAVAQLQATAQYQF